MVAHINYLCDNCSKGKAEHLGPLDLGDGKCMIDLCAKCVKDLQITAWAELLAEYGVEAQAVPVARSRPAASSRSQRADNAVDCPVCRKTLGSRSYCITHLQASHSMSPQTASRAVQPVGRSVVCSVCDMLLDYRGLRPHMAAVHPDIPYETPNAVDSAA